MPEYLAPAVFVEETSFRSKSIEGVGTSTAAFIGLTSRGPVTDKKGAAPPLLTSFADFDRIYGGFEDLLIEKKPAPNYLAHAVRAFFDNGGGRLYVARVLAVGAARAERVDLNSPASSGAGAGATGAGGGAPGGTGAAGGQGGTGGGAAGAAQRKSVWIGPRFEGGSAIPGSAGVNLRATLSIVEQATTKGLTEKQPPGTLVLYSNGKTQFTGAPANDDFAALAADAPVTALTLNVLIEDPSGNILEYPALGFHRSHPRFAGSVLGKTPTRGADAMTNPLTLEVAEDMTAAEFYEAVKNYVSASPVVELKGGSDGSGPPTQDAYANALEKLSALEDVSIIAAPGGSSFSTAAAINSALVTAAEKARAYRIAVLDTPPSLEIAEVRDLKSKIDSKYAAIYYPWVIASNPMAAVDPRATSEIPLPPSGFVCGIYARSDIQRGVWKAPANETILGALGLQRDVSFGEQEVLNPLGVNCLRFLPNRGYRVWGARTASSDPEWKYVNIRRYFLYLESSIDRGTQWAVFEPNGDRLWANVRETVSDFLYNEWINGALLGGSPKEAFFVRCDRTTMTQNDLDNGRLICLVGIAAIKPAEFVIFRIGQKTADARG